MTDDVRSGARDYRKVLMGLALIALAIVGLDLVYRAYETEALTWGAFPPVLACALLGFVGAGIAYDGLEVR